MGNTLLTIAIIVFIIIFYFFFRKLTRHREPWDDIEDIKFQEDLNEERKQFGLKPKQINYKTGKIKF